MGGKSGKEANGAQGTKVSTVSGDLADLIAHMQVASNGDVRVQLLAEQQKKALTAPGAGTKNCDGTIGALAVQVVGVACVAEFGGKTLLASNAFNSCIPVVIFSNKGTWLAHANGASAVNELTVTNKDTYAGADVFIICKSKFADHVKHCKAVLDALGEAGYSAEQIDIPTAETLGVLVSGVGKLILVYRIAPQ